MIKSAETKFPFNLLIFSTVIFIGLISVSLFLKNDSLIILLFLLAFSLPVIYLLFFKLDMLVFITVLAIPLSVKLLFPGGVAISIPAEILSGIIAVFYIVYRLLSPVKLNSKIFMHPLTILVLMDISWLIITTLFSELPVISIKRLVVRLAFMVIFFFIFSVLFTDFKNITKVWLLYGIGLLIPIFSTLYNHSHYGFVKAVSFMMTKPFYNDHTQYATCIAYILPVLGVIIAMPEKFGVNRMMRILIFMLSCVLITGEIFSFSRAAWLSIAVALLFTGLVVFLRFRLVHFMLLTLIAGGIIYHYRNDILQYVEKVDSVSRSADTEEHMESVMNIQTDASNLERINRWQCALRMFRDRPLTGFGPGTYQFIYGKYQITPEMTRISTNHGERGNAHSEFLTYLSETGLPGFIIFNLLLLVTISTGIRIYRTSRRKEVRWLAIAILMGFITYFFHGLFNSFMDTDKASVLVYGSLSALVALDVYHREVEK
jgi:putative inorganic carbon (hco3(-)) transporter